MPIIEVRFISFPRKIRRCDNCHDEITRDCFRLFGHAEASDTPYPIFQCLTCSRYTNDQKLIEALHLAGFQTYDESWKGQHDTQSKKTSS